MTGWYPLNVREAGSHESYDALSEGVPEWIRAPLLDFVLAAFTKKNRNVGSSVDKDETRKCSAAVRIAIPDTAGGVGGLRDWLDPISEDKANRFLAILDWIIKSNESVWYQQRAEEILASGNSAWTVGRWGVGHGGLVRRVDPTVTAAAAQAISTKTSASHHLAEAWQAAYGMNGDPSKAYREAVKAVEFAAIPVVSPKDTGATLGKVLGQVRSDGDWTVPLTREKDPGHVAGMLVSMLGALWVGQSDRHGSAAPSIPITTEAAQAAVLMATTLVQWFQSGAVRRGTI